MRYDSHTFRGDALGGITAAVIGLPSALALGVASGLGALAGLYGAIAVGFFAAVFGGTRGQISCPTGPTTVAMAVIVTTYADTLGEAFTIVILAGLLQVLLGAMKMGRYVVYTPYSVRAGFMSGIGLVLILIHVMPFLGAPNADGGLTGVFRALPQAIDAINFDAFAVALLVCVFWPRRFRRVISSIPVGLVVGTLLSVLWLADMDRIGEAPGGLPQILIPDLSLGALLSAAQPALILAILASINSLLMSLARDTITRTTHKPDRELWGQGIGNIVTGLIGGVPGAGSGITVVNARVGGRTPVAGVLCSGILLAVVLGFGEVVEEIPLAVLAGLMMKVGWDLINWRFIVRLRRVQREHLLVMLATLGLTMFVDLLSAIAIGLVLAGMVGARQLEFLELDSVISAPLLDRTFLLDENDSVEVDPFSARVGLVAFKGILTVASSSRLYATLSVDIQDHEVVILDFSDTLYVDNSAAFVLEELVEVAESEDTECIVVGLAGSVADLLQALRVLDRVQEDRFVRTMEEARNTARRIL